MNNENVHEHDPDLHAHGEEVNQEEKRESWGPSTKIRTYLIRDIKKLSPSNDYRSVADLTDLTAAFGEIAKKFEEFDLVISTLQSENAKLKLMVQLYEEGEEEVAYENLKKSQLQE